MEDEELTADGEWCPECGLPSSACRCQDDDEPRGDSLGCLYPGKCVMPGEHYVSECATAEMMEEMEF